MSKSGLLTEEEKRCYDTIRNRSAERDRRYQDYVTTLTQSGESAELERKCSELGLSLNVPAGTLCYSPSFQPLALPYEVCYVRHGKTEGNTEPRVFQGQVDYPENQLNAVGRLQAQEAAQKMESMMNDPKDAWVPDIIVYSPLGRAIDTGLPFATKHNSIPSITVNKTAEMAFGSWDNQRVIDIPCDSLAHMFYLYQNAVVRADAPHCIGSATREGGVLTPGTDIAAENFVDLFVRIKEALLEIGEESLVKNVIAQHPERRPRVLMYGHSMAGAAVSILLGHGKQIVVVEGQPATLGFDGSCIMHHATPTVLHSRMPTRF